MRSIGLVSNQRREPIDDNWDLVDSQIQLDLSVLDETATDGLRDFSHVEVVYVFHRVEEHDVETGARHPRGNAAWPKVGILAQRPKMRPNRIGTTICELMAVRPGGVVEVRGLDAIDGSPVLDIKPYFSEFGPRGDTRQPPWSRELMAGYWIEAAAESGRLPDDVAASWLEQVCASPKDNGFVAMIVRRPEAGEREVLTEAHLDTAVGLVGDNWQSRGSRATADGLAEADKQLNIMNVRAARLVAGSDDRVPLAGDQLFVDLDLGYTNLPIGTRLAIGEAIIEVTAPPHTGCAKFTQRFGLGAHRWINGTVGRANNLRGICAKVVTGGAIRQGDTVRKL